MTDDGWVTFDAPLEVLEQGRGAYPAVRLPEELDAALKAPAGAPATAIKRG